MNPSEKRSSDPSSAQVETLIEFMEINPGTAKLTAKGFLSTQNATKRSRGQWEELAVSLNRIGGTLRTIKTYKQWTENNQLERTPTPNPHLYHPSLPSTITLCLTLTPSRSGSTQVFSVTQSTAASSYSRHAASFVPHSRRLRTVRGRRGSVSSRHKSSVAAPPSSQRRTKFFTERFLRLKEQQLEIERLNTQILQSFLEWSAERDKILAEAVATVGKGLQALAEAKNSGRV